MKGSTTYGFLMRSLITAMIMMCLLPFIGAYAQDASTAKEITLKAVGGLQYDIVRFRVSPGEQVRLILKNTDDMDHNLLITQQGKREKIVRAALEMGDQGPVKNFIPESPSVLYSIPVLGPGEEATLT